MHVQIVHIPRAACANPAHPSKYRFKHVFTGCTRGAIFTESIAPGPLSRYNGCAGPRAPFIRRYREASI